MPLKSNQGKAIAYFTFSVTIYYVYFSIQSRPTEASKELDTLEYGALKAKSYIPGTEALPVEPSKEDNNGML